MIVRFVIYSIVIVFIVSSIPSYGQENRYAEPFTESFVYRHGDEAEELQNRARIVDMLEKNISLLVKEGRLSISKSTGNQYGGFIWPLKVATDLNYFKAFGMGTCFDHNPSGGITDYSCGARTYNGHLGTDLIVWPFPWHIYQNDLVEVVAAKQGTIIGKRDGNPDHCTPGGDWNAVYLLHDDGSSSWYGHLKNNSVTTRKIGEQVQQGEYLGIIGSSGLSSGIHLHLEIYKSQPFSTENLIDPFSGSCNTLNNESWWIEQPEYFEPSLNALLSHSAPPVFGCSATEEQPNLSDLFSPDSVLCLAIYPCNARKDDVFSGRIMKPDGTVWRTLQYTMPDDQVSFCAYWWFVLPSAIQTGTWKFEVYYRNKTYTHEFRIDKNSSSEKTERPDDRSGLPITLCSHAESGIISVLGIEQTEIPAIEVINTGGVTIRRVENPGPVPIIDLSDEPRGVYVIRFHGIHQERTFVKR